MIIKLSFRKFLKTHHIRFTFMNVKTLFKLFLAAKIVKVFLSGEYNIWKAIVYKLSSKYVFQSFKRIVTCEFFCIMKLGKIKIVWACFKFPAAIWYNFEILVIPQTLSNFNINLNFSINLVLVSFAWIYTLRVKFYTSVVNISYC